MDNVFEKMMEYKTKGIPSILVTVTEKEGDGPVEIGKKMLVTETNEAFGTVGGGGLEYHARELCKELLLTRDSRTVKYLLDEGNVLEDRKTLPMVCGGKVTLFFEYIGVRAHIYIFGGGHVGQALIKVLKTMNFHVTIIDNRESVIKQNKVGDQIIYSKFTDFITKENIRKDAYIVVCTPSHKHDYKVIDTIFELGLSYQYLGMVCSKEKIKDYLSKAKNTFGDRLDLSNFYSPIGLDIGGGSPQEIAVSISAEILAISYGKDNQKNMRNRVEQTYQE